MTYWKAPTVNYPINATVNLPASKSLTNRYLALAALANSDSNISNFLIARDAELMIEALKNLGVNITENDDSLNITPNFNEDDVTIDCGLAGTVMRFVPLIAAFRNGKTTFTGDVEAKVRPMSTTLTSLEKLGVEVTRHNGEFLPFTVHGDGEITTDKITIDAAASSQFISALLLIGARCKNGLKIEHTGANLPSKPLISMTVNTLKCLGIEVNELSDTSWKVNPGKIPGFERTVEPDLANATPFVAAAMITNGTVKIPFWPKTSNQPGFHLPQLMEQFGGKVSFDEKQQQMSFYGPKMLKAPNTIDLTAYGELVPNIAALSLLSNVKTEIIGIGHLRGHETDRINALATEFNKLGGIVIEHDTSLEFNKSKLHGTEFLSYKDHRMATTGAIIGLKIPDINIENIETVSKTMPEFTKMWEEMIKR
ncbi:MAG: 3-phosphoshikimate 1-carboxyvinyltransferase [Micrococcaceae bacterium]